MVDGNNIMVGRGSDMALVHNGHVQCNVWCLHIYNIRMQAERLEISQKTVRSSHQKLSSNGKK